MKYHTKSTLHYSGLTYTQTNRYKQAIHPTHPFQFQVHNRYGVLSLESWDWWVEDVFHHQWTLPTHSIPNYHLNNKSRHTYQTAVVRTQQNLRAVQSRARYSLVMSFIRLKLYMYTCWSVRNVSTYSSHTTHNGNSMPSLMWCLTQAPNFLNSDTCLWQNFLKVLLYLKPCLISLDVMDLFLNTNCE